MEQLTLREQVIKAVDALQLAEKSFHQANAQLGQARSAGSATATLQGRVEHEAASERLLEAAAKAEEVLASYRKQTELDYHESIQAGTVKTRALHEKRLVLQQQLEDLRREIEVATEAERPAVSAAVEAQQTASTFAGNWERVVSDSVKLTQGQVAA